MCQKDDDHNVIDELDEEGDHDKFLWTFANLENGECVISAQNEMEQNHLESVVEVVVKSIDSETGD